MNRNPKLNRFKDNVLIKYQIYNSIFTTLPFDTIKNTGVLLPLFEQLCAKSYRTGSNPSAIIQHFFNKYFDTISEKEKIDLLFQFVQFIERQIVLFDAIEESAFPIINNMNGIGSVRNSKERAVSEGLMPALRKHLNSSRIRVVLTAHPTQFYPGDILSIITDLGKAIDDEDMVMIKKLLAQLGKTPFFKYEKPSPYDEAVRLIWFLENIFYQAASDIYEYISDHIYERETFDNQVIEIGFWPGGDRDGNPFVTSEITLKVAQRLRQTLLKNYHRDLRLLKRRLTFREVAKAISSLENRTYEALLNPGRIPNFTAGTLIGELKAVRKIVIEKHNSLFVDLLDALIDKILLFGLHFASLDIRQDSSIHEQSFAALQTEYPNLFPEKFHSLSEESKLTTLSIMTGKINVDTISDFSLKGTLESMQTIKSIQKSNGEKGAHRYIISNTKNAVQLMQVYMLMKLAVFPDVMPVDIVPLFETVDDLNKADQVMELLYQNDEYRSHLKSRRNKQTIMLGFSDGTKDGGYLMANWSIFLAKEKLTKIARKHSINVVFFDGRGGPPSRGGGKTHQFYASLGENIAHDEIQLTIQGQTISSKFGSISAAKYNLEQLLSAGIENAVFYDESKELSPENRSILDNLAKLSYETYTAFKNHPKFLPYLEEMSTLKYYAQTNIGSRPSRRKQTDALVFSDLRAIPYVGSWSQLKQNVPGFYGVGSSLKTYEEKGEFTKLQELYQASGFFKALIENSMMALTKSYFELTAYMKDDDEFGDFWQLIYSEYLTTKRLLLKLTGQNELMENYPSSKASIETREKIVLPLLTIQQFALQKIQLIKKSKTIDQDLLNVYEKLVVRSLYGNINASRNSA